jgi:hypothetical protein
MRSHEWAIARKRDPHFDKNILAHTHQNLRPCPTANPNPTAPPHTKKNSARPASAPSTGPNKTPATGTSSNFAAKPAAATAPANKTPPSKPPSSNSSPSAKQTVTEAKLSAPRKPRRSSPATRATNPTPPAATGKPSWSPRSAARRLVAAGKIVITRHSHPVDPATAKGPIRLRLR